MRLNGNSVGTLDVYVIRFRTKPARRIKMIVYYSQEHYTKNVIRTRHSRSSAIWHAMVRCREYALLFSFNTRRLRAKFNRISCDMPSVLCLAYACLMCGLMASLPSPSVLDKVIFMRSCDGSNVIVTYICCYHILCKSP